MCTCYFECELGVLEITGTEDGISSISFDGTTEGREAKSGASGVKRGSRHSNGEDMPDILKECVKQLDEYFNGMRKEFELKLSPEGTAFQKRVWEALMEVPFGNTESYGDIAKAVGSPNAVRAVGGACGRNRIAIVIPCHRILGGSGKLTGYAGELWRKEWLLSHEKKFLSR